MTELEWANLKIGGKIKWIGHADVHGRGAYEILDKWGTDFKVFNAKKPWIDKVYSRLNWEKVNDTSCD